MKLTDTQIKNTKPTNKRVKLPDGGGLVLFVEPRGAKLWRKRYRFDGVEKLLSLGAYPDVTLKMARDLSSEISSKVKAGIDPSNERKEQKLIRKHAIENTFKTCALAWWQHWQIGRSPEHVKRTWQRLELDVFPVIGNSPMERITTPILVSMIKEIAARGALDMAKRALSTTGQVFRYALQHGVCDKNPAADIKPVEVIPKRKPTNQLRVDLKDLPALLRDIDNYRGRSLTRLAVKLLALTFVRTTELIEARWCEFDLTAALWSIPAERMKMGTPHLVPLARQTVALLLELRAITGNSPFLFPSQGGQGDCMSNNTILFALYRMGYQGKMTGHGFRGLASTILNEQRKYHEKDIETQLSHLYGNAVRRAYDHSSNMPERTEMMQEYADYLDKLKAGAEIIPMVAKA
jgi:integrase